MAEQKKGIVVTHLVQASLASPARGSYPNATSVRVGNLGHLFVEDEANGGTLAVYAPDKWLRAEHVGQE